MPTSAAADFEVRLQRACYDPQLLAAPTCLAPRAAANASAGAGRGTTAQPRNASQCLGRPTRGADAVGMPDLFDDDDDATPRSDAVGAYAVGPQLSAGGFLHVVWSPHPNATTNTNDDGEGGGADGTEIVFFGSSIVCGVIRRPLCLLPIRPPPFLRARADTRQLEVTAEGTTAASVGAFLYQFFWHGFFFVGVCVLHLVSLVKQHWCRRTPEPRRAGSRRRRPPQQPRV